MGLSLESLIPFAAAHEIIRQGKRNLTLIGPISDMLFDQVIGAGCVKKIRAAWVGNVITGSGYNFRRGIEAGQLRIEDHSNLPMAMALKGISKDEVDVIVTHAPGTVKGDQSEYNAIRKVFGATLPALTSNKWIIGHSLGASGGLSLEMAILMMRHQQFIGVPFGSFTRNPQSIRKVLVNAVGFGGNAVSVLLSLE